MNKKDVQSIQFNLRFRPEDFRKIKLSAEKLGYLSIAQLIRDSVKSFLNQRGYQND